MPAAPTATRATTARALLDLLRPYGPTLADDELDIDRDLPADLGAALCVLHTGIRALLAGTTWYGCGSERATAAARPLDPASPIRAGVTLLAAEGDRRWHRIGVTVRLDLPHLFVSE